MELLDQALVRLWKKEVISKSAVWDFCNDRDEISKLNEKIAGMEKAKKSAMPSDILSKVERVEELSSKLDALNGALEEQRSRLSGLETAMSQAPAKKGAKAPAPAQGVLVERMDRLEKRISEMGTAKPAKGGRQAAPAVPDGMSSDLKAIKARIDDIEKKAGKPVIDTSLIDDEIRKMKEQFPVGSAGDIAARMGELEKKLSKLSKLAMALKPIELPDSHTEAGPSKNLELRIRELERLVGAGVGDQRFRALEKKMDDLKEWLPEYIDSKVKLKLQTASDDMQKKIKEMDNLKEELISSTVEQLLAQPGTVSKMMGDKLKSQVEEIQKKLKNVDSVVRPSDAKLTSLLREADENQKEIARLRAEIKGMKSVSREEIEDMGTEIRALNTRLDSIHTSVKGVESTGVSGVMRDLEILKTKADWLESTVHKLDLEKLYARIEELESMMRTAATQAASVGAGPIIIE